MTMGADMYEETKTSIERRSDWRVLVMIIVTTITVDHRVGMTVINQIKFDLIIKNVF